MRRRSRLRRLLKWTGTLACILILLGAAACLKWWRIAAYSVAVDGGESRVIGIIQGGLFVYWNDRGLPGVSHLKAGFWIDADSIWDGWAVCVEGWRLYGVTPEFQFERHAAYGSVVIPLWIPFLLVCLPTAWLWRVERRRVAAGGCDACAYDLTGNVSGRCPECGTPVKSE